MQCDRLYLRNVHLYLLILLDRVFKTCNTWIGFDKCVKKLTHFLLRNSFPEKVIHRNIKEYLEAKHSEYHTEGRNTKINYFKLPYVGEHSDNIKKRLYKIYKNLCKLDKGINKGIRIIVYTSKIRDYFSTKDLLPKCFNKRFVTQMFQQKICYPNVSTKDLLPKCFNKRFVTQMFQQKICYPNVSTKDLLPKCFNKRFVTQMFQQKMCYPNVSTKDLLPKCFNKRFVTQMFQQKICYPNVSTTPTNTWLHG